MAQLAIKGDRARGSEIIALLKMLGGVNTENCNGEHGGLWYFINEYTEICFFTHAIRDKFVFYTLEEFFAKYPYKVGDKVYYNSEVCDIIEMLWNSDLNTISYGVYDGKMKSLTIVEDLKPYKDCNKCLNVEGCISPCKEKLMESAIKLNTAQMNGEQFVVSIPKGYELAGVDDDKQQVIFHKIQLEYPKTYEECCKVLGYEPDRQTVTGYDAELIENFQTLKLCRDAYWKIAGEQMGLDGPWEPNWGKDDDGGHTFKYCACFTDGRLHKIMSTGFHFLAFPTEEMRDKFVENFESLIIGCEELYG